MGNEERQLCFEGPCPDPGSYFDTLYALDAATGKEEWRQDLDGGYYRTLNLTLGLKYICYEYDELSEHGLRSYLRGAARKDGTLEWQQELDSAVAGQPAIADNTLILQTRDGTVYGFQLP